MSSDKNVWERLFKLWATICKLLVDGKRSAEIVAEILQKIVDEGQANPYLRRLENVVGTIAVTTGQRNFIRMKELFRGYFDSDFVNYGTDVEGEAKPEIPFEVFELVKDGTFAEIFRAFGVDFDKLCWSQDQIITFVEKHADLLHPQGYATFFLFRVRKKFFVASVDRNDDGQLKARVRHLSRDDVWRAEYRHRFVIPQL